jgi:hypothetical protein
VTDPNSPFSTVDLQQLAARGLTPQQALGQLDRFRNRPRPAPLIRACTLGDGIRPLPDREPDREELRRVARAAIASGRLTKFVPASGAASRMFQRLIEAHNQEDPTRSSAFQTLHGSLDRFAFFAELKALVHPRHPAQLEPHQLLEAVLGAGSLGSGAAQPSPPSLGLAERPKGLIPFHRDASGRAHTAFEDHLVEAAQLSPATDQQANRSAHPCRVHFTISPEHRSNFETLLEECRPALEDTYGVRFLVDFSTQDPATDTLAGNFDATPFRDSSNGDGRLVFRPGGHGALIGNLAQLGTSGADLVTVKNIDNIRPARAQLPVNQSRLSLIGLAANLSRTSHDLLADLDASASYAVLRRAIDFLVEELGGSRTRFDLPTASDAERETARRRLVAELDRPLRVCGMVVNDGEPGGGPFWIEDDERGASCQIIESAQIDRSNPQQNSIVESATHFNPVELVCSLRDWRGEAFDLERFIDDQSWFVSEKSKDGRPLLALERPGLWNGAMGRWNTVFVEVPSAMFAPVKTVLDLLREEHQSNE